MEIQGDGEPTLTALLEGAMADRIKNMGKEGHLYCAPPTKPTPRDESARIYRLPGTELIRNG